MSEEQMLEIPQKEDMVVAWRDDLRAPEVVFGRCCLTGEWGTCAALDLGDIVIEAPDTTKGVEIDPVTQEINFTVWKPVTFHNIGTFSKAGLQMLMDFMDEKGSVIPTLTPILYYMFKVLYTDGSCLTQFRIDPATEEEEELHSGHIDFSRVSQISVVPHLVTDAELPTYTFDKSTGKFFKNGQELDIEYDGIYPDNAEVFYAREVIHSLGSTISGDMHRSIYPIRPASVVQLLGWKVPGGPQCVIGISDDGSWRGKWYTS